MCVCVCVSRPPEEKNFWTHFVSFKEVATIKIIFYMQPCSVTTKVLSFVIRERTRLDEGIIQDRHEGRRDEGCKNTTMTTKRWRKGGAMDNTWQQQSIQQREKDGGRLLLILQSS